MNCPVPIWFFLFFFVSPPLTVDAQNINRSGRADGLFRESFRAIYNFNFRQADSLVSMATREFPADPATWLVRANYFWWLIVSGEDGEQNKAHFKAALKNGEGILVKKSGKQEGEDLFMMISFYAFKSRFELLDYNYLKAVLAFRESVHYMKQSFGKETETEAFYLTSGLYNYFCSYGMKQYPVLYPTLLFFPSGNMAKGLQQLEKASVSKDVLLNCEGNYFLLKIYNELEPKPELAKIYVENLLIRYPANLMYHYLHFNVFLNGKKLDEARKMLAVLHYRAQSNPHLTEKQKKYFLNLAQDDLKKYYRKNNSNPE